MTRQAQKDDEQQRCCFIYSNSDEFMKVVPQKKTPRSTETSVLNKNGEWVSISSTATTSTTTTESDEDNDDDDLSVDHQSDGSSVQFDEYGRPSSYNSIFDYDNNDTDNVADINDDENDDKYETDEDEDEHDEDECVETAPATTHNDDDDDDDSCNSSRIVGFDEKAYAARIEAEIAKEEDLAAERLKVRTEKQRIAKERSQMDQEQQRERQESLMASKQKEAQRLAEAAADLERIAIQAEKELAEAECIATAAQAAHAAMVSASVAKSVNQRIETMKRNPIQISRISKIASQQESESFEKVQRDVAEMVESERLSSEYKQIKWVSQTSEEERSEAEKARNWGHNPLEGMSPSRGRGSPKKSSSLPSVSNNRKKQQQRPKKSQSLQEGKGKWVSVSL